MKKTIAILILVLIVAAGAAYLIHWKRVLPLGDLQAAGYLLPDTIALLEITDMPRSKTRWQETALHQIAQEPQVAAFLAKPMSMIPSNKQLDRLDAFRALDPKEVFIAVTGQGAAGPKVIAGFDFKGNKKDAEALVADVKTDLEARFPDGKSDIEKYEGSDIETFTYKKTTIGTVFKGPWFFASNDLDGLRSTLDRVDGKIDAKTSLGEADTYKFCVAKLPPDSDAVAFVEMKGIVDYLSMAIEASQGGNRSSLDELKKIQAIAASTKFDGENLRDALYVYKPGGEARPPLAFNSKAFTSPATVLYFALAPVLKTAPALPSPALDQTGIFTMLGGLAQELKQQGLGFEEFKAAFGPEYAMMLNWGGESTLPGGILTLDVRDAAKAGKFTDTLAATWSKQEADGVQYYSYPSLGQGLIHVSPMLALTDKALVFGIDFDSVQKAVKDAKAGGARIDKSEAFQAASDLVSKPTDSFGYIDSRVLFGKVYELAYNYLTMAGAFTPGLNRVADFGKLPKGDTITKHLGPIVYSQSTDENGSLTESAGPVTFTEVMFGVGAGAGIAAGVRNRMTQPRNIRFTPTGQPSAARKVQTGVSEVELPPLPPTTAPQQASGNP